MVTVKEGYKERIAKFHENLSNENLQSPGNIVLKYIYKVKDTKNSNDKTKYYAEKIQIENKTKKKVYRSLISDFKKKMEKDPNVHGNYKLDFVINGGNVGILEDALYPSELKDLIKVISSPSTNARRKRMREAKDKGALPDSFSIETDDFYYIKKVDKIKIASGRDLNKSLLIGTKSQKIKKIDEDFLLISFVDPDFVVCKSDNGTTPTLVYNSYNLGKICATYEYMKQKIIENKDQLEEVIDSYDSVVKYLDEHWQVVHSFYFTLMRGAIQKLKPNYIEVLNSTYLVDKVKLDNNGKLITSPLGGGEVFNILLQKYGKRLNEDGVEDRGIVESFIDI